VALEAAALGGAPPPVPGFRTVVNPVRMMAAEHDATGEALRRLRALAGDYALPAARR